LAEGVLGSLRESKGVGFKAIVVTKRDMKINVRQWAKRQQITKKVDFRE
jgi:hypothetical protein